MKVVCILFTLQFLIAWANPVAADIISEALEIPYQAQNADRIISGTVVDIHQSIFHTSVTVQVNEWLMNPVPAKTITIRTEGGKSVWVEDQATFDANETVLLMLEDVDISKYRFKVLWGAPAKHLDSLEKDNAKPTGMNEIPFIRVNGMLLAFFGAVLAARFRK